MSNPNRQLQQLPQAVAHTLPHSVEAEMGVLGSMLIGGAGAIEECVAKINAAHFYVSAHQIVYESLVIMNRGGTPTVLITVTQALNDIGHLETIGGAVMVTELFTFVPTAANLGYYLEIVREKYMLRSIIGVGTEAVRRAYEEQHDTASVLQDLQSQVIDIGQLTSTRESLQHVSEIVPRVVENLEATYRNRGEVMGLPTGFVDLDRMLGGWMPARVHVIAARPAMGKTSLATEFAEYVALDAMEKKSAVAFFSVEMTSEELIESILLRRSRILLKKLRSGMFSKEERAELDAQAQELIESKLFVDETAGLSIFEFRARARRAVVKHGVRLIIIDYIGLMRGSQRVREKNREQEIAEIMQGIIDTAKEMKVAIIVLAQLNRETERTVSGVPKLADVRESGSIEQGAHFVGLLYRPSYYAHNDENKLRYMAEAREMSVDAFKEVAELIVAKNRRGPVGTVPLRFVKEFAHFESEDPDRPLYSNDQEERQRKG